MRKINHSLIVGSNLSLCRLGFCQETKAARISNLGFYIITNSNDIYIFWKIIRYETVTLKEAIFVNNTNIVNLLAQQILSQLLTNVEVKEIFLAISFVLRNENRKILNSLLDETRRDDKATISKPSANTILAEMSSDIFIIVIATIVFCVHIKYIEMIKLCVKQSRTMERLKTLSSLGTRMDFIAKLLDVSHPSVIVSISSGEDNLVFIQKRIKNLRVIEIGCEEFEFFVILRKRQRPNLILDAESFCNFAHNTGIVETDLIVFTTKEWLIGTGMDTKLRLIQ